MIQAVTFHFDKAKPFFPMYIHLIISALLPIYTGAHSALSRPSTAAKPDKQATKKRDDDDDYSSDEEDDEQQMEGLSKSDAIIFPITAGLTLAGLFWLMKVFGKEIINVVFGYYFSIAGVAGVGKLANDGLVLLISFIFPDWYVNAGNLWKVNPKARQFDGQARVEKPDSPTRHSPLPGKYGWFDIGASANERCWALRELLKKKYTLKAKGFNVVDLNVKFTIVNVFSIFVGLTFILFARFAGSIWWVTNVQGFAVCYGALQILSPTAFTTGSLILTGLFFYDIWAVFFTPLMESVAKNLDQPIKLVFPRPEDPNRPGEAVYSMLGLGDIVLPGIMIGLALRFDLYMFYYKKQTRIVDGQVNEKTKKLEDRMEKAEYISPLYRWSDWYWTWGKSFHKTAWGPLHDQLTAAAFPKPYFNASMIGYVVGMITTLGIMSVFEHAQPALLYLVPGVLSSLWLTAFIRGEVQEMWDYSEAVDGGATNEKASAEKKASEDKEEEQQPLTWKQTLTSWFYGAPEEKSNQDSTTDDSTNDSDKPSKSNSDSKNHTADNTAEDKKQSTSQPPTPPTPVIFKLTITAIDKGRVNPPLRPIASKDSFTNLVEDGRPAREARELVEEAFGTKPCSNIQRFEYSAWLVE